jgi:hypothetical protein
MPNTRGPLPGANPRRVKKAAAKRSSAIVPATQHPGSVPNPPIPLAPAGQAAWAHAWSVPWTALSDQPAILNLAQLEDERALLRKSVDDHGILLSKPIVSPKGEIVGDETYVNPALRELRRTDVQILALRDRLGLSPLSRARATGRCGGASVTSSLGG